MCVLFFSIKPKHQDRTYSKPDAAVAHAAACNLPDLSILAVFLTTPFPKQFNFLSTWAEMSAPVLVWAWPHAATVMVLCGRASHGYPYVASQPQLVMLLAIPPTHWSTMMVSTMPKMRLWRSSHENCLRMICMLSQSLLVNNKFSVSSQSMLTQFMEYRSDRTTVFLLWHVKLRHVLITWVLFALVQLITSRAMSGSDALSAQRRALFLRLGSAVNGYFAALSSKKILAVRCALHYVLGAIAAWFELGWAQ